MNWRKTRPTSSEVIRMENRDFKGVWIPKEVWLDRRLNALEKVILAEIDSLDMGEDGCFASNKYLAEFCGCSESKVSSAVSKLIKFDYIFLESFDGRTRILKSRLTKNRSLPHEVCDSAQQNFEENNIDSKSVNNTDNKLSKGKQGAKKQGVENHPLESKFKRIAVEYTSNKELQDALNDFVDMRKLIKKPLTERAFSNLLRKLESLSKDEQTQIAILEQSIDHDWQGVYPLKTKQATNTEPHILDGIL